MKKMKPAELFNAKTASPAQIEAIRSYTGEGYINMGTTISRLCDGGNPDNYTNDRQIALADIFMNYAPDYKGRMYRGMHNFNILAEEAPTYELNGFDATIGDVVELEDLASWTRDEGVAIEFANGKHPDDEDACPTTVFYIENGVGYDVAEHARIPKEKEVLTPPATRLRVKSIEDRGCENYFVELEMVA